MKDIKVASFFSGIGGFEEGIKKTRFNSDIVIACEIDKFARKSYSSNFKTKIIYEDIRNVDEKNVPDHDLLVAGFPCQSFSIAGKQLGFKETRGTLFFELERIITYKKPKYILLENVKNLVNHDNSNTIDTILNVMSNLGYCIDFEILNSCNFEVPQNRERTYILGILNYTPEKYCLKSKNINVSKLKEKFNHCNFNSFNFFNTIEYDYKKVYLSNVIEENVDEKYYIKNKNIEKYIFENKIKDSLVYVNKINKIFDLPRELHNDLERQRRVYSIKGISPTILARADSAKIFIEKENRVRKLTPIECSLIQGFDRKFIENISNIGMSDTQMYKQIGNAVSPPVISAILERLYKIYE